MFDHLEVFRLAGAMAGHAGRRQTVAAANVAQADTPGYRARTVEPFAALHGEAAPLPLRSTRPGHLAGAERPGEARILLARNAASPDGNTVSLESEMADAADASSDHNRAVAIYRSGLAVLRASIGGR